MSRWIEACLTWPHPVESCFQFLDELFVVEVPLDTLARYAAYTAGYILETALIVLIVVGLTVAVRELFCQPIVAPSRAYIHTRNFYVTALYNWTGLKLLMEQSLIRPQHGGQQRHLASSAGSSRGKQRATKLPRERLVEVIEEETNRTISLETDDTPKILSRCNPQAPSPLFQLPRELRDRIWQYTMATYEDSNNQHAETAYYYRPGHTAFLETDTNVLLTCRRVWLEAHSLPLQQTEHTFWFQRGPYDEHGDNERKWRLNVSREIDRAVSTFGHLTAAGQRDLSHVHLVTQMFLFDWFALIASHYPRPAPGNTQPVQQLFASGISSLNFRPKVLQITFRHTDWWHWELDYPLRFEDKWLASVLDHDFLRGVQQLKLELETLDYKRDQLEAIVARLRQIEGCEKETHIVDGEPVTTKFVPSNTIRTSTWTGPTNINNEPRHVYSERKQLKYTTTTLTWNLVFPSLPQGNVSKLRWQPRIVQPQPQAAQAANRVDMDEHQAGLWEYDETWWTMYEDINAEVSDNDEMAVGRFHRSVRLRRRLWRRLKFVWPAFVRNVEQRDKQKEQGDELVRTYGRRFEEMRQDLKAREVEEKWARTGSLLRFEPSRETNFAT